LRDYHEQTQPVLDLFRTKEQVYDVDARAPAKDVHTTIRKLVGLPV
jgi:adenylate kinase